MTEEEFHKKRIAFMIIDGKVIFLKNSKMSHIEWYSSLNYPLENFNNIVRGYAKEDKIVFYKGNFEYDDIVISEAKRTIKIIKDETGFYFTKVFADVKVGNIGEDWPPILEIKGL